MIRLENTYAELPPAFFQDVAPSAAVKPELLAINRPLADELGLDLDGLDDKALAELFSGKKVPKGARTIAMAYAGHQFGNFVPQLGDGRAILLGEVVTPGGRRVDIHLKGAGRTQFSRGGDGRSSLGPVIREYLVSEAMHAFGISSTRALAAVATGESVYRDGPLPGAVMARVASSHIRVGTFEFFAARQRDDLLQSLADYVIARHYPHLEGVDDPYIALFEAIAHKKLALVARWMGVGFIHGVMNTDNTSVSGETIDFGPCAFMDTFLFDKVYSSIDRFGRYRYRMQGKIALWNLSALANCLVPIVSSDRKVAVDKLNATMMTLPDYFDRVWLEVMAAKLGIFEPEEEDKALVDTFLLDLQSEELDFTNSFRALPSELDTDSAFFALLRARLERQDQSLEEAVALMRRSNPSIIPRNHQVEKAIEDALDGDLGHFRLLNEVFANPYGDNIEYGEFKLPPEAHEVVHQTFCGT